MIKELSRMPEIKPGLATTEKLPIHSIISVQGLFLAMSSEIAPGLGDHMGRQGMNPDLSWLNRMQGKNLSTVLSLGLHLKYFNLHNK